MNMDFKQIPAFGVAGNFTGHLEQAGEDKDFIGIKTEEEIARENVGKIKIYGDTKHYTGRPYAGVEQELRMAGFTDIELKEMALSAFSGLFKESTVAKIIIDGKASFNDGDWFRPDAKIVIYYYVKV